MLRLNLTILNATLLTGCLAVTVFPVFAGSAVPKRLHSNIDGSQTFILKGNTRPAILQGVAQDQGQVSSSMTMPRMSLHFSLSSAQQADLDQLLAAQQNRRSRQFHKFLTPEEYAARFGLNEADLAKVTAWLENTGFSNVQVARSRTWVSFVGTAGQVELAFRTAIHKYSVNGEPHFANATDPQLPNALSGIAQHLSGLHNFRMKPHMHLVPHFTSSITKSTFLAPGDWETIYDVNKLYGANLDGSPLNGDGTACGGNPCSIVVVGQSDVQASDLANFRSAAGLPAKAVTVVVPPGDTDPGLVAGICPTDQCESDLDLEWAGAIAKNGNILFVTADGVNGNGVEDSIAYAIDNNAAPILSTSYGLCEAEETTSDVAAQNSLFQEANANGMTIVSASGDAGAADCDSAYPATLGLSVDFPSASPYVTGVGGTTLTVTGVGTYWGAPTNSTTDNLNSALQYIPESVWNDTNALNGLSAGGGGASVLAAKPDWQTGTGVPNDGHRDVPDIALAASPSTNEMLFCSPGFCTNGFRDPNSNLDLTGGTSAGAPPFAGVLALLVQQTGSRLGNINPNLYTIAQISQTAFHDITSGNNIVPCRVGTLNCSAGAMGYSAGIGYDQASGWGSIDAYNLVEQWSEDIEITASPTTLTVQPGSSGTATVTVAPFKNFSGTVSFACSVSSGLANVTCSVPSTTVDTQGTTMVTIAAASTAHSPFWRGFRNVPPVGRWWILLALALAIALRFLRKRRFVYSVGAAAAVLMFVLGALSCGGGSSTGSTGGGGSTPAESGTVTVTATSGQIINSVSIGVTIP